MSVNDPTSSYWYRRKSNSRIAPANTKGLVILMFNLTCLLLGLTNALDIWNFIPSLAAGLLLMFSLGLIIYSLAYKTEFL